MNFFKRLFPARPIGRIKNLLVRYKGYFVLVLGGRRSLLLESGLFEEEYYLSRYPDVAGSAIHHYIRNGWREGRSPHPLFDPAYYQKQVPSLGVNRDPLTHFLLVGGRAGFSPSRLFDTLFYLRSNPDVCAARINPLLHYLRHGAVEGRDPNPDFHTTYYVDTYPDVADSVLNPLVHYARIGKSEGRRCCDLENYSHWASLTRTLDEQVLRVYRNEEAGLKCQPKISILMTVYNTPEPFLRAAILSVRNQVYSAWELCIVNDYSSASHIRPILAECAACDSRIRVKSSERNGGIAVASNQALDMASGEFIVLLDHDDLLHPCALLKCAQLLEIESDLDMIYSDEDKIDEHGFNFGPFFKPDWSPDYMLSMMYTCHLGMYRTTLVREIGGFRKEFDGAQDYDMVLRLIERTDRIGHVPAVLYHWRVWSQSTASGIDAKPYAEQAARRALHEYVDRCGLRGDILKGSRPGQHRVRFTIEGAPVVSIIIPTANEMIARDGRTERHIDACIASIERQSAYSRIEFVIVHNGNLTTDQMTRFRRKNNLKMLYYGEQVFNLACKINMGCSVASGDHFLILNDDVRARTPECISALLEFSQLAEIGAVGAKLHFPNGNLQHVGIHILGGRPGHHYYGAPQEFEGYGSCTEVPKNYLAVTGAAMMTSRKAFEAIGGWDERFMVNYNDVDYCLRLRDIGLRITWTPYSVWTHFEGASRGGAVVDQAEIQLFNSIWGDRLTSDPYYNRNLSKRVPYGFSTLQYNR